MLIYNKRHVLLLSKKNLWISAHLKAITEVDEISMQLADCSGAEICIIIQLWL